MFLDRSTVSRKTPKDGKLEITESAAARVGALPTRFELVVNGELGVGSLESMRCTCRGAEHAHTHHFLQSELLKGLPVGGDVSVELLDDVATIVVVSAPGNR